mmetsp:Transcript_6344/g.19038  ORF Transcript_6344/g.19038 Transcript_6344/m.19038 type:complete len:395 (+) Transcript_6344:80-1264(+)
MCTMLGLSQTTISRVGHVLRREALHVARRELVQIATVVKLGRLDRRAVGIACPPALAAAVEVRVQCERLAPAAEGGACQVRRPGDHPAPHHIAQMHVVADDGALPQPVRRRAAVAPAGGHEGTRVGPAEQALLDCVVHAPSQLLDGAQLAISAGVKVPDARQVREVGNLPRVVRPRKEEERGVHVRERRLGEEASPRLALCIRAGIIEAHALHDGHVLVVLLEAQRPALRGHPREHAAVAERLEQGRRRDFGHQRAHVVGVEEDRQPARATAGEQHISRGAVEPLATQHLHHGAQVTPAAEVQRFAFARRVHPAAGLFRVAREGRAVAVHEPRLAPRRKLRVDRGVAAHYTARAAINHACELEQRPARPRARAPEVRAGPERALILVHAPPTTL